MTINQMKDWIRACYPTPKWEQKLRTMSDAQVIAIFKRLQKKGVIRV